VIPPDGVEIDRRSGGELFTNVGINDGINIVAFFRGQSRASSIDSLDIGGNTRGDMILWTSKKEEMRIYVSVGSRGSQAVYLLSNACLCQVPL
jgi:hypothetical protein